MDGLTASGATVRRSNLKQDVAQYVRDLILSGAVRADQRLDQDAIAAELGVSRLPVREALIVLEGEGLVESIARRGTFVASLEPEDFTDHFEMYGLVSGLAAARASTVAPVDTIEQLDKIVADMHSSTDPREQDRLNFAFHQTINKAGASRRLLAVLRTLSNGMPTHFFEHHTDQAFREQSLNGHDIILDALRTGDGRAASEAMVEHFATTGNEVVSLLKKSGFWENRTSLISDASSTGGPPD